MTNEQKRSARIWALAILLACGTIAIAASVLQQPQQSTQNANSNTSRTTNKKANSNANSNGNDTTSGDRVGMATLSSQEKSFVMEAAMGGIMEVELGRMAAQLGSSDAVKQFGQRMVDDHSKANDELKALAASKNISLPTELDEKHKNELTKMQKLTGPEFDTAYSKAMLKDHEKDVAAFEKQSTKGDDADIKAFAAKTLPTLREHLEMARSLSGKKGTMKSTNANN